MPDSALCPEVRGPAYDGVMTLHLRNTLSRTTEAVAPLEPGRIGMYTCGPTVYRYAHVGNLRSYLLADLLRRVLLYHGLDVFHVKNITDVGHLRDEHFDRGEDRMLVQAGLESKTPAEIAAAYEAAFHADEAAVNILPANVYPRATEHIPEMVALAERLQDAGLAYASDAGNLYYSVASFPGYGQLSGNTLDALRAGHRGDIEPDKRDPADFALWKAAGDGRILRWDTARWGPGFPGWHLECSAMAMRYLGDRFDIHTGGIDNIFPHHEDEIAQSAPLVGDVPATMWVHGEHLLMGGHKMAKSAGNFQRVTDLVDRGLDPLAFRYLVMTSRYGRKLNYTDDSVAAAAAALDSLRARLRGLGEPPMSGPWVAPAPLRARAAGDRPQGVVTGPLGHGGGGHDPGTVPVSVDGLDPAHHPAAPLSTAGRALHDRFIGALDDDLDFPTALAVLRETLRADLPADERRWLILDADRVLGLDLDRTWDGTSDLPPDVQALADARTRARAAKDWPAADAARAALADLGWDVIDGPDGPDLRRRPG